MHEITRLSLVLRVEIERKVTFTLSHTKGFLRSGIDRREKFNLISLTIFMKKKKHISSREMNFVLDF